VLGLQIGPLGKTKQMIDDHQVQVLVKDDLAMECFLFEGALRLDENNVEQRIEIECGDREVRILQKDHYSKC
jgi:hypothetical protein